MRSSSPSHFRVNRLRTTTETLIPLLEEQGIALKPMNDRNNIFFEMKDFTAPGNLIEYYAGLLHPQALSSCIAAEVLAPEPDSMVLDMCASPGGKTSHIADIMNNTGVVIANELFTSRHRALIHTLERLGILNTIVTAYQAQEFPKRELF